jgi:hypothetical protein
VFGDDPKTTFLLKSWSNGKSVLPLIQHLMELGKSDEAATIIRLVIPTATPRMQTRLQALLDECSSAPVGWTAALESFVANPSQEEWDALLRFIPEERRFQRLKAMILQLIRLRCDGNLLFGYVSSLGFFPELFDLAKTGTVDPELIEQRASGSPSEPAWLGLAALAAFARNDHLTVTRYLWKAQQHPAATLSWPAVFEIRNEADEALNRQLTAAGIRNFEHE